MAASTASSSASLTFMTPVANTSSNDCSPPSSQVFPVTPPSS
eukprot:CAMPEP_0119520182 /NCGR_PEP_ID=MMETSP1344-20130328/36256_1 /TAXON_ID=236787 /ORGANISM="Florenciella parvula, Strain CCMP2471" /LENGTH=41 /DNA_ID= /DNA_START= /DNA_END= /DNA_ORIENTATION=